MSTTDLVLSHTSRLPVEAVTSTIAVLGKKGSGKTYTAKKLAEIMLNAGYQVVILDTVGAWWGLKSSADGKSPGFAIPILGGDHGDIKLDVAAGEVTARAIIEGGFSCIVDVRLMSKGGRHTFAAPFLETIYQLNRHALHLFVDEADFYAPQKTFTPQAARTLGAMDELVRRGRQGGTGVTMITQRPQVLNKDVLTASDILFALRLNHPLDINAVLTWVKVKADPAIAQKMLDDLPGMPTGDYYAWAPELGIFGKSRTDPARTFDSSATPKPGKARVLPKTMAEIDIAKLGARIQSTVEEQKANDPATLKARIRELEQQAKKTHPEPADHSGCKRKLDEVEAALSRMRAWEQGTAAESLRQATFAAERISQLLKDATRWQEWAQERVKGKPASINPQAEWPKPIGHAIPPRAPELKLPRLNGNENLPPGESAVLRVLAQYPDGLDRGRIGVFSGYTKRSTRNTYISRLQSKGYATTGETIRITPEGMAAVGEFERLPEGRDLFEWWLARLPEGERKMLEVLAGGDELTREDLGERTGYTARSTRNTYISRLSQKMLVDVNGDTISLAEDLQ